MSEKTDRKRALILESAWNVFAQKGYRTVTMKDIVEASGISRGGLYLYFSSVEEVFLAVLENEEKKTDTKIEKEQFQEATSVDMLLWFLKLQKKILLLKKGSLLAARYEYAFACREQNRTSFLKKERKKELLVLQKIIERGMESGEFFCLDAACEAENIMLTIDGLKLLACTNGVSEAKIDKEFLFMMQRIVEDEE